MKLTLLGCLFVLLVGCAEKIDPAFTKDKPFGVTLNTTSTDLEKRLNLPEGQCKYACELETAPVVDSRFKVYRFGFRNGKIINIGAKNNDIPNLDKAYKGIYNELVSSYGLPIYSKENDKIINQIAKTTNLADEVKAQVMLIVDNPEFSNKMPYFAFWHIENKQGVNLIVMGSFKDNDKSVLSLGFVFGNDGDSLFF